MNDKIKQQEKAIKDIILKYGETINLKKTPYLIGEIIRNYASHFNEDENPQTGPIPGSHGVPPPPPGPTPPPGPAGTPNFLKMVEEVHNHLQGISKSLLHLHEKLDTVQK